MSAPSQPQTTDALSKKILAKWGREEMQRIQEAYADTLLSPELLNLKLMEAVSQRALSYSEKNHKLLIQSSFPLPEEVSSPVSPGMPSSLRIFPSRIEVQEIWISFDDKSMMLLAIPSEKTRSFGRFLMSLRKSPQAARAMGFNEESLAFAREVMHLAEHKRFVIPMSPVDFSEFISKKRRQYILPMPSEQEPSFSINADPAALTPLEMLDALELFSKNPSDYSWSKSVNDWLGASFA